MRYAAVGLLLVGCSGGPTILEVDGSAVGADRVELVIGDAPCGGAHCTVTGPDGTAASPVLLRDGLVRTAAAPDASGIVRFQLEPEDATDDTLGNTIVVGWRGDTPVGYVVVRALPLDKPGVFHVALAAAAPDQATFAVWTNDAQQPTTAQYACVTAPDGNSTITVVPAEDPDCDGFTGADECAGGKYIYDYMQPAKLADAADATCAIESAPTGASACRVGANGCVDGHTAEVGACTPSKFCVPLGACDACGADTGAAFAACLLDQVAPPAPTDALRSDLQLACPIDVVADVDDQTIGDVCTPNAQATLAIRLSGLSGVLGMAACDPSSSGPGAVTFAPILDGDTALGDLAFGDTLEWPVTSAMGAATIRFEIDDSADEAGCDVGLVLVHAPEIVDPALGATIDLRAIARYQLANGFVAFVPMAIQFHVTDACPTSVTLPDGDPVIDEPRCTVVNAPPPGQTAGGLAACFDPTASPN